MLCQHNIKNMVRSSATLRLHNLVRSGRRNVFSRGQVLQSSDGRLMLGLIDTGYIKRYQITSSGSIGVHGLYGPGNFFPLTLAFELLFTEAEYLYTGPEVFYYEALTDVAIYNIENEVLTTAIDADPMLYRGLLAESGKRLHFYIQRLENITLKNSSKRVAHQLVFWAMEFGEDLDKSKGIKILPPMTHQLIADVLSLTRETVSQSIGELRNKGLIKTSKAMVIPDLAKLQEEAYS